jgi:GntR family transcriptional regulator
MGLHDQVYLSKHRQIIKFITSEIKQGHLKPYDRLPSENELCNQWQASRTTIRRAMDQLSERGVVLRVAGRGSFVAIPKISHQTSQILSFAEKMRAEGLGFTTKLILKEIIKPTEEITQALKLVTKNKILMIQRLHIVQNVPMALQTSFMPLKISRKLLNEDLESNSLNQLLREKCNVHLSRNDVWIEAHMVTKKERLLLGNPSVPLFLAVIGLTYNEQNEPVRFSRGVYRGDRVRMKFDDSKPFELI